MDQKTSPTKPRSTNRTRDHAKAITLALKEDRSKETNLKSSKGGMTLIIRTKMGDEYYVALKIK